MSVRESDPVKRAKLHAARMILMGLDSLLTFAQMQAEAGGAKAEARKIAAGDRKLHEALDGLVERLRTS